MSSQHTYILHPWEYPGGGFSSTPDAEATLDLYGRPHAFLLKVRERRVYFRRVDRRQQQWALTELLPTPETDLVSFWREQVGQGNFGRYAVLERGYDITFAPGEYHSRFGYEPYRDFSTVPVNVMQRTPVAAIILPDGSGWLREWCAADWMPMPPCAGLFKSRPDAIWDWGNHLGGLSRHREVIGRLLAMRPIQPGELQSMKLTWARSSRNEFARLAHLWFVAAGLHRPKPEKVRLWAGYPFTYETWSPDPFYSRPSIQFEVNTDWERIRRAKMNTRVLGFIAKWPQCVGIQWYGPEGGGLRMNYRFEIVGMNITIPASPEPSGQEQRLAADELWQWLEGKVSRTKIRRWQSENRDF